MNKYLQSLGVIAGADLITSIALHSIDMLKVFAIHKVLKHEKIQHIEFNFSMMFGELIVSALNSTLPAVAAAAIDKFVHSSLTDNKAIQYTATAIESVALSSMIIASEDFHIYFPTLSINGRPEEFWPSTNKKHYAFPKFSKFSVKNLKEVYNYLFTQEMLSISQPPQYDGNKWLEKLKYAGKIVLYLGGIENNIKNIELGIRVKIYITNTLLQSLALKYIWDDEKESAHEHEETSLNEIPSDYIMYSE